MKNIFASRLLTLRMSSGLTQGEIANKMKIETGDTKFGQSKYQRYESGQHEPNLTQIIAFCHVFKVSADWMLGLSDEQTQQQQQNINPSLGIRLKDVKRNAEQATASINALQTAIEKLNNTI